LYFQAEEGIRGVRVTGVQTCALPISQPSQLAAIAEQAERAPSSPEEMAAEDGAQHPADGLRGTRLVPTLLVDAAGVVMSLFTRIAPWAPLPPEIATLLSLSEHHPVLKERLARGARSENRADSFASMLGAVSQGLAAGNESILLDVVQRAGQWREARALERAWWDVERSVVPGPEAVEADALPKERHAPLPEGEIERYQRTALKAGAAAGAVALPF